MTRLCRARTWCRRTPGVRLLCPKKVRSHDATFVKKKDIPLDPWGNAYNYKYPGENGDYDLYSLGRDNVDGGEGEDADVVSW